LLFFVLVIETFGFRICFDFRVSKFGFTGQAEASKICLFTSQLGAALDRTDQFNKNL
jgi:hypothetical protein